MSQQQGGEGEGEQGLPLEQDMFNLRFRNDQLPSGKCVYIQSGDPGDFDGYMIGVAGAELEKRTEDLQFVIVMPERRACADREEPNVNKHDEGFSEEVMHSGALMRHALACCSSINEACFAQHNAGSTLDNFEIQYSCFKALHELPERQGGKAPDCATNLNGKQGTQSKILCQC
eukprot:scaffold114289_cov17-Tisochrysis_lutea.AAC.1